MKKTYVAITIIMMLLLSSCNLILDFCPHNDTTIDKLEIIDDSPVLFEYCNDCKKAIRRSLSFSTLKDIPVLNIKGSLAGISKENKVQVAVDYFSKDKKFSSYATLKLQGASSLGYPKKNYNIQFYTNNKFEEKDKIEIVKNWGNQSKYTLKANYIDFSQSRNVVSGRIYGKIAKTRNINDGLEKAPNYGAVDGFPIVVFRNGEFLGLYTMNIAKDDWMFAMKKDKDTKSALLMADNWKDPVYLSTPITNIDDDSTEGFVCEFKGDDFKKKDIIKSFNTFTEKVRAIDSRDKLLQTFSADSSTMQRTIDSMIFTIVACATDNVSKNIIWATYDGKTWFPSIYDFDGTWGLGWDGEINCNPKTTLLPTSTLGNILWQKLYTYYYDEIVKRYKELRQETLSYDAIIKEFENFFNQIPQSAINTERKTWTQVPSQEINNIAQIKQWTKDRLDTLDMIFGIISLTTNN